MALMIELIFLVGDLVGAVLALVLRLVVGLWDIGLISYDFVLSRRSMKDGVLHCPKGHPIPLTGDVYECQKCGFVYEGSALICANPECGSRTPYINCPVCGRSRRSPYRYGRNPL